MHNLKLWSSPNNKTNLTKFVDSIKDNLKFNSILIYINGVLNIKIIFTEI